VTDPITSTVELGSTLIPLIQTTGRTIPELNFQVIKNFINQANSHLFHDIEIKSNCLFVFLLATGCGVFDEWRPDLMGTCRPDYASNVQERDISVTTPYGRIRGFYVHLFDGPGVPIGDRPGVYHNGKLWRRISTFLGIPYATPPVNEGRFKVIMRTTKSTEWNFFKIIKL
jgi:hypothetical protein